MWDILFTHYARQHTKILTVLGKGLRNALDERGIAACVPSKSNHKTTIPHDPVLYRQRHKIENMFGRLKDWRRINIRYDHCAHIFLAVCIATTVIIWLGQ